MIDAVMPGLSEALLMASRTPVSVVVASVIILKLLAPNPIASVPAPSTAVSLLKSPERIFAGCASCSTLIEKLPATAELSAETVNKSALLEVAVRA